MKLHAVNWEFPVLQSHDLAVVRLSNHRKTFRYAISFHHKGVITRRLKRLGNILKKTGAVVPDLRCLSVHHLPSMDNLGSKNLPNTLVTETYAQNRLQPAEFANRFATDTGGFRPSRSGRDANALYI